MTAERLYCIHEDGDVPELTCGYPLPCPFHTAEIEMRSRWRAEVRDPASAEARREALGEVALAIVEPQ